MGLSRDARAATAACGLLTAIAVFAPISRALLIVALLWIGCAVWSGFAARSWLALVGAPAVTVVVLAVWWLAADDPGRAPITSDPCDPSCGLGLGEILLSVAVVGLFLALIGRGLRASMGPANPGAQRHR